MSELAFFDCNAHLELTALLDSDRGVIEKFCEAGLVRRLLFGTDLPWFAQNRCIGAILSADLTDDDRHNILHRNAERLVARFPGSFEVHAGALGAQRQSRGPPWRFAPPVPPQGSIGRDAPKKFLTSARPAGSIIATKMEGSPRRCKIVKPGRAWPIRRTEMEWVSVPWERNGL